MGRGRIRAPLGSRAARCAGAASPLRRRGALHARAARHGGTRRLPRGDVEVKIALVHDYLTEMGGAERVVEVMTRLFPGAPLYTSAFDPSACPSFAGLDVRTTFAQRPTRRKRAAKALFFTLPFAFRSLDLR